MRITKRNLLKLSDCIGNSSPLFLVGGYVRNRLLKLPATDIDLCSALKVENLQQALAGSEFSVKVSNKKLNTAKIFCENEVFEYSTFREESYAKAGKHLPTHVSFDTSIVQDAKRRDFTINCIYYSFEKKKVIDFYGGVADLQRRLIRTIETPEEVLSKDGDRILRLAKLVAELGFDVEKKTFDTAKKYVSNISKQSGKIKFRELSKIMSAPAKYKKTADLEKAILVLDCLNAWQHLFCGELANIHPMHKNIDQTLKHTNIYAFATDLQKATNNTKMEESKFFAYFLNSLGISETDAEFKTEMKNFENYMKKGV